MGLLGSFKSQHIIPDKRELKAGRSVPAYPVSHHGITCLVVGTAPCWADDFSKAMHIVDHFEVCAVNEATRLIHPHHVATVHTEKIDYFCSFLDPKRTAIRKPINHVKRQPQIHFRELAYEWDVEMWAGSAIFAALVMASIGYDRVILCGCPMDGGGGYAFTDTHKSTAQDPRIGDMKKDHAVVRSWAQAMKQIKDELPAAAVIRSMSGTTQRIFGGI